MRVALVALTLLGCTRFGGVHDDASSDTSRPDTRVRDSGDTSVRDTASRDAPADTCTATDICNGIDDDCDPATHDGSGDPAVGIPCDSEVDADLCADGAFVCTGGALVCDDDESSLVERCDMAGDEDCDGASDEGCLDCAAAIDVSAGDGGRYTVTTVADSYVPCGGTAGGSEAVVRLEAPIPREVFVSTLNSGVDTSVVQLSACPAEAAAACPRAHESAVAHDDPAFPTTGAATLQTTTGGAPVTYFLIDAPDAPPGTMIDVDIWMSSAPTTLPGQVCSRAVALDPAMLPVTHSTAAYLDVSDPERCPVGDTDGDRRYYFRVETAGNVTISTCGSTFDTMLYLRTLCDPRATTDPVENEIECDDDTCHTRDASISRLMEPGLYYFVVDGYRRCPTCGADGEFALDAAGL